MLNRRTFLEKSGQAAAGLAVASLAGCGGKKRPPNIVLILADDMGWGDTDVLNSASKILTPNLNRLASEGLSFTDAHAGSALCTPTRYGLLTGRYAWRSRLKKGVLVGYSPPLIETERLTVASLLKEQGYHTACIGKWHLGLGWPTHDGHVYSDAWGESGGHVDWTGCIAGGPTDLGFDEFFGISASLDMEPYVFIENDRVVEAPTAHVDGQSGTAFFRGGPCAPGFKHDEILDQFTDRAVSYIDSQGKDQPFFLYFALPAPHTPILPSEPFQGRSGIGPYGDFVMQCDDVTGRIMQALEAQGLSDDTLLIFTSDNGCAPMADVQALEQQGHYPSGPYRGYKADIYEGGHRIPLVMRWPRAIQAARTCDQTVCLTDVLATCADILNVPLPREAAEDSFSWLPALKGNVEMPLREATVHHSDNGSLAIRQGLWKLNFCPGSGGWSHPTPAESAALNLPPVQLYNVVKDPGETDNVAAGHPEIVRQMTALMQSYIDKGRSRPEHL